MEECACACERELKRECVICVGEEKEEREEERCVQVWNASLCVRMKKREILRVHVCVFFEKEQASLRENCTISLPFLPAQCQTVA